MAPLYRIAKPKKTSSSKTSTKRTVKFLAVTNNPRIQRAVLKSASDSVYKSICNAFLNLAQNPEIKISSLQEKDLLKRNHARITKLISPNISIRAKKSIIQKGGGLFLGAVLPLVLSQAINLLGSAILPKLRQ